AAATGLDVSDQLAPAVTALQMRVRLERRQGGAARQREVELAEDGTAVSVGGRGLLQASSDLDQFRFALAAGDAGRTVDEQIVRVERRVQPVKADPGRRILPTDAGGDADAETERRVHRDGDQDEPGAANPLDVERLHRDVEHGRAGAGALEKRRRPGDGE